MRRRPAGVELLPGEVGGLDQPRNVHFPPSPDTAPAQVRLLLRNFSASPSVYRREGNTFASTSRRGPAVLVEPLFEVRWQRNRGLPAPEEDLCRMHNEYRWVPTAPLASRFWTATGNTLSSFVKSAIENPVYTALLIAPGPDVSTRAACRAFSLGPNCPAGKRRV